MIAPKASESLMDTPHGCVCVSLITSTTSMAIAACAYIMNRSQELNALRIRNTVMRSTQTMSCLAVLCVLFAGPIEATENEPGESIDYITLAFYPDRWEKMGADTTMYPWQGKHVVLLSPSKDHDPKIMARFIDRLDAGWTLYEELVGAKPKAHKKLNKRVAIAAVPDARLTCGAGCGRVGHTGIEVARFSRHDYPMVQKDMDAFAHYYFYEMGRNYFVFGNRHDAFQTGFAVFMRYVCMDALECKDPESGTRRKIEQAEAVYAESKLGFLDAFTVQGRLSEKQGRLPSYRGPSDQPVMYASAMLYLYKSYGKNDFLKAFYKQLLTCPTVRAQTPEQAMRQTLNWLVSASCAAGEDLTPVFIDRWRMPLAEETRKALEKVNFEQEGIKAGDILETIPAKFVGLSAQ